jgi:hypothetical protein
MAPRERALYATAALLYSGPLYAGLAGHGRELVPLFAIFFMLWLFVVRPGDWPATAAAWRSPRAIAWPLLIFSVQLILVGFCLGVGRAIGGVFGVAPPLPVLFTLLVSMFAISLARLLQPADRQKRHQVPGGDLAIGAGVVDVEKPQMPGDPDDGIVLEDVMTALADLDTDGAPGETVIALAGRVERAGMAPEVLAALADAPDGLPYHLLDTELALRPAIARTILGQGHIERVMVRALGSRQAPLIERAAAAAGHLVAEVPGAAEEMPPIGQLEEEAARLVPVSPGAVQALTNLVSMLQARALG